MVVGIVSSGIGTTASMLNMFRHIGADAELVVDPAGLAKYSHLVLPGVGHYSEGSSKLAEGGWREPIIDFAKTGKPLLGVCLGMQLLGQGSAEGPGDGLGLLPFTLERIRTAPGVVVPHMGWNSVAPVGSGSALLDSEPQPRFYFVHSYAVPADSPVATATTVYGTPFASMVGAGNVFGAQFHPEKSHRFGMALLRNFAKTG